MNENTNKPAVDIEPEGKMTIYKPDAPMIYGLIGQAMREIGAIGKTSRNEQQKFMYRGIDAVYNALNPVMAKLGIFITPEILEQKREERVSKKYDQNGNERTSVLFYSIITVRYTVYAPDGSNIQLTVIGEGMDSGDKATNKALSIAMKYAMFQLFMIPTEDLSDPDADTHTDITPKGTMPAGTLQDRVNQACTRKQAEVTKQAGGVPATAQEAQEAPKTAQEYIKVAVARFMREIPGFNLVNARAELIATGKIEDVPSATMTMAQAVAMVKAIDEVYGGKK